mmetsp:Transcript_16387/g.19137  ORF Transcript_16387/g.19137 Transcript_16387/m.19137 type:complete len:951 (+) Transcript_16387:193-3045(+)
MSRFSRQVTGESIFRNVIVKPFHKDKCYHQLSTSDSHNTNGSLISSSSKHLLFAASDSNNSKIGALKLSSRADTDLCSANSPTLINVGGAISDIRFSPIETDGKGTAAIAAGNSIHLLSTSIADDEANEVIDLKEVTTLSGGKSNISSCQWNLSAPDILAATANNTVQVWDVTGSETEAIFQVSNETKFQDLAWSRDNSTLFGVTADSHLLNIDVRNGKSENFNTERLHEGRGINHLICGRHSGEGDIVYTTGQNSMRQTEIAGWDTRNMSSSLFKHNLKSTGSMNMLYDIDTELVFLLGRGQVSMTIADVHLGNLQPYVNILSKTVVSSHTSRGSCLVPKPALDVYHCEVGRLLNMTASTIEPVSFNIARKRMGRNNFHEELYPSTLSNRESALSGTAWSSGENAPPNKVPLRDLLDKPKRHWGDETEEGDGDEKPDPAEEEESLSIELEPKNAKSLKAWMGYVPKFKHVRGSQQKKEETIFNVRANTTSTQCLAATEDLVAVPWQSGSGGPILVRSLSHTGPINDLTDRKSLIDGHSRPVVSLCFSPFDRKYEAKKRVMLATGSADCTTRVWRLPCDGFSGESVDLAKDSVLLTGHNQSVSILSFHPLASDILTTAASDNTTRVWNVEREIELACIHSQAHPVDLDWNFDGSRLIQFLRNGVVNITDPRKNAKGDSDHQAVKKAHEGGKPGRISWLGNSEYFLTSGQGLSSVRECKIWDTRKSNVSVETLSLGMGTSVFTPHYIEDNNVVVLLARGELTTKVYELEQKDATVNGHHCADFMCHDNPTVASVLLPRRACDTSVCEVARIVRLANDVIDEVSYKIPRAKDLKNFFADDLFPNTARNGEPVLTAEEWAEGKACSGPNVQSLNVNNLELMSERTDTEKNAKKVAARISANTFMRKKAEEEKRERERNAVFNQFAQMATSHADWVKNQQKDENPDDSDSDWSD